MKHLILSLSVFGVIAANGTHARADAADAIAGFATGVITGAIINNQQKSQPKKVYKAPKKTGVSQAQRQQNRDVQTALNYFNYPVGVVDGALGKKSRAAISQLQADLGYVADGYLDDHERAFLIQSYHRAQAGVMGQYAQVMASYGTRGLLKAYHSEQMGGTVMAGGVPNMAPQPYAGVVSNSQAVGVNVPQGLPQPQVQPPADLGVLGTPQMVGINPGAGGVAPMPQATPQVQAPVINQPAAPAPTPQPQTGTTMLAAATPAAPMAPLGGAAPATPSAGFAPLGGGAAAASAKAATLCAGTKQASDAKGGLASPGNLGDPTQALNEQFCAAREFVISDGSAKSSTLSGASPEQIAGLCATVKDKLGPIIATLPSSDPDGIIAAVASKVAETGSSSEQFVTSAQICLGRAYGQDDMEAALASAALLVTGGEESYGELIGHHLRLGMGATDNSPKSTQWHSRALKALEEGAPSAILPNQAETRAAVLRMAMGIPAAEAATAPAAPAMMQPLGGAAPTSEPVSLAPLASGGAVEANAAEAMPAMPELELITDRSE